MKFAWVFIAHLAKWPPVVEEWGRKLRTAPASTGTELVQGLKELLSWCDRREWVGMFDRMHGKHSLMDAQTGLLVHSTRMLLIESQPGKKSSTRKIKKQSPMPPEPTTKRIRNDALGGERLLFLGRAQAPFQMLPDTQPAIEILDFVLSSAADSGLRWPANADDVPAFADKMLELIKQVRRFTSPTGKATLKGGLTQHGYNAKHFLRLLLLCLEDRLPGAFDGLPFSRISGWCPDENNHGEVFGEEATGSVIRQKFGCSPLMWSCWACLVGFAEKDIGQAVTSDHAPLWERFLGLEASMASVGEGGFAPGPHVLMEA